MTNLLSTSSIQSTGNGLPRITSRWIDQESSRQSSCISTDNSQSKLYSISEYLFGYYDQESLSATTQHQNLSDAISQLKKSKVECNIKIFWLQNGGQHLANICKDRMMVTMDLDKPPQLMPLLKVCENVFDWLAKDQRNVVLFYCHNSDWLLLTVVYAYSHYYDTMQRREIHQSVAMKSFLSLHSKSLEKVPVSYRRYAGYMSLYSCMNQLHCNRSSVNIYCLILYNFPAMESDTAKTSQLFFKIYTNDPLKCSHTTKLYCLPRNVNRLVILFDQYPIVLRNDTMIVCYHSNLLGNKRTKILRLNFHTCQATGDMLTFYSQDFEDLYPACPFRIKLDLYFQATAVFGQGEANFSCDSKHNEPSQLERCDSYSSLAIHDRDRDRLYLSSNDDHQNVQSLTVVEKTKYTSQNSESKSKVTAIIESKDDIPIGYNESLSDRYRSTKSNYNLTSSTNTRQCDRLTEVGDSETSMIDYLQSQSNQKQKKPDIRDETKKKLTTELSEAQEEINRLRQAMTTNVHRSNSERKYTSQEVSRVINDRDKIDTNDSLKLELAPKTSVSTRTDIKMSHNIPIININHENELDNACTNMHSNRFISTNQNTVKTGSSNNKEVHLYPELLQAQKELSKLRESTVNSSVTDTCAIHQERQMSQEVNRVNSSRTSMEKRTDIANIIPVHSDQIARARTANERNKMCIVQSEEFETVNLQPIGKGIHDLTKVHPQTSSITLDSCNKSRSAVVVGNIDNEHSLTMRQQDPISKSISIGDESALTLSMIFMQENQRQITLKLVESKISWWYKPAVSREEAIVILTKCCPGSFLIRDSNTFAGAFGLALKVENIPINIIPKSDNLEVEKIRHYLIEPLNNHGVYIKGFPEEPIFPTLAHLVLFYCQTKSVLPCLLRMPDNQSADASMNLGRTNTTTMTTVTSPRSNDLSPRSAEYSVYYLGCYDADHFAELNAIDRAIEHLLKNLDTKKFSECRLLINVGEGIELIDVERKLFFKRRYSFSNITLCGVDPHSRLIQLEISKSKVIRKSKVFGLIVKNYNACDIKCLLFADLYDNQNAYVIVKALLDHLQNRKVI